MDTNKTEKTKVISDSSVDLWKFFEERGGKIKESMFKIVTWIVGFAAVVLGFAVKEGFEKGLTNITHPDMLVSLGLIGLLIVAYAALVIRDYGKHINRTFARADAARDGETSPKKIWDKGKTAENMKLPPVCFHYFIIVGFFAIGFVLLILLGLYRYHILWLSFLLNC